MQSNIEIDITSINPEYLETLKKLKIQGFLDQANLPRNNTDKIIALINKELDFHIQFILKTASNDIDAIQHSDLTQKIIDAIKSNPILFCNMASAYIPYKMHPPKDIQQLNFFNLLKTLEYSITIQTTNIIKYFFESRQPNSAKRQLGNTTLAKLILMNSFELANYLLSLDLEPEKTMNELVDTHSLYKRCVETFNTPSLKWLIDRKPEQRFEMLRFKMKEGLSFIHLFERKKQKELARYLDIRVRNTLQQKIKAFEEVMFVALGYDQKLLSNQLDCLTCSPEIKTQIACLAETIECNIISTFEFVKGQSPVEHTLIKALDLDKLLVYYEEPQQKQPVKNQYNKFLMFSIAQALDKLIDNFISAFKIFNPREKKDFKHEVIKVVTQLQVDNIKQNETSCLVTICQRFLQELLYQSLISNFNKNMDKDNFSEAFDKWKNIFLSHMKQGNKHILEYLFFNSIINNNVDTIQVAAIALAKAGWYLDKYDEKLVMSLNILLTDQGEPAFMNMFQAVKHAFHVDNSPALMP